MAEEMFGPVLPLVPVESAEHAVELVTARDKPLALYVFTEEKAVKELFRRRTSSGGLAFNAPLLQLSSPELPFGGVGESGTGAYHGKFSFTTFSHARAVLDKPLAPDTLRVVYPPYRGLRALLAGAAVGLRRPRRRSRHAVSEDQSRPSSGGPAQRTACAYRGARSRNSATPADGALGMARARPGDSQRGAVDNPHHCI